MADGISIDFDFGPLMNDIEKLGQDVAGVTDKATLKAANVVADRVKVNLKRSRKKSYPPEYVHMQDDVKVGSLIDEDGDKVREVGGGRKTGYKWRFLEDGTSYMTGTQFASRTKLETEKEVEDIILEEVRKVLPE